ncbi:MAG TPA: hypothetical protein VGG64_22075 [Pirellulales bacterium]|jgi:hypothetical protein
MPLIHRRKLFVDSEVQGALLYRVFLYWLICVGLMVSMLACWQAITGPFESLPEIFAALWFQYSPALVVTALVLPLILFDVVRISNRFVGPVYRLRQSMRRLVRGEEVRPIKFREGDFWQTFADEFNSILTLVRDGDAPESVAPPTTTSAPTVNEAEIPVKGRGSR